MLLALLLAQLAAPYDGPILVNPATLGPGVPPPFFEFAPASGAGMTDACACSAVTGSKGETLTFTRTGNATCSKKGFATTGIADGDLVVCAGNQPRVMPDSDGVRGLLVEASRSNGIIRSEELDAAAWSLASGGTPGPGNPTRTKDAAVAPDGTTTAEKIDFPSVTGTGFSVVYNTAGRASTAASWTHTLYVRGVTGSGTIYLMSTPGGTYRSAACTFVATSWTRCTVTGTETATTWYYQIGFDLRDAAQSGQGAQSVYVWGAQGETGSYATSYIPTTTAAVTRNGEVAYVGIAASSFASGSMSIDVQRYMPITSANVGIISLNASTSFRTMLTNFGAGNDNGRLYVNGSSTGLTATGSGTGRFSAYWGGGGNGACFNASCATGSGTSETGSINRISIGNYDSTAATISDAVHSRVCVDPSPTRCR